MEHIPFRARQAMGLASALTGAAIALTACGSPGASHLRAGCRTVVHGVVPGPGSAGISLPVSAGPIVSRQTVLAKAGRVQAKLSSWTEIAAMLARSAHGAVHAPRTLRRFPWRPVWAVLLTGRHASVAVFDAATGRAELTTGAGADPGWFAFLTDRDLAGRQCQGGSSARLPFGVPTRDEETYIASAAPTPGATTSVRLVLSTIPAINRADPSMYGGCTVTNCSIDQLVWVAIQTVTAAPGKTIGCLPGSASVPAGYRPKQVKRYSSVSVPDNFAIYCGAVPRAITGLDDLAPALTDH